MLKNYVPGLLAFAVTGLMIIGHSSLINAIVA